MLKRMTLSRVRIRSVGKVCAILGMSLGVMFGFLIVIFSLIQFLVVVPRGSRDDGSGEFIIGSLLAFTVGPIVIGVLSGIGGMILAVVYNLMSDWLGGLEYEVDDPSDDDCPSYND